MTGFDAFKAAVGAGDLEEMTEYSDKFEGRKGLLTLTKKTEVKNAACGGPIAYTAMFFLISVLTFGKFLLNFERLVLGCIEAEFCK